MHVYPRCPPDYFVTRLPPSLTRYGESGREKIPSVTGRWLSTPMSTDPAAGVLLLSGVGAGPPPDGV
jgi:hypothetical protein